MSDQDLPAETAVEKSGDTCPNCGTELPSVVTAYGSHIKGVCPKCEKGSDLLKAQKAAVKAADKAERANA